MFPMLYMHIAKGVSQIHLILKQKLIDLSTDFGLMLAPLLFLLWKFCLNALYYGNRFPDYTTTSTGKRVTYQLTCTLLDKRQVRCVISICKNI